MARRRLRAALLRVRRSRVTSDFITRAVAITQSAFSKPLPLILLLGCVVLYASHTEKIAAKNAVHIIAGKLVKIPALKSVGEWMIQNPAHTVGAFIMGTSAYVAAPTAQAMTLAATGVIYAWLLPQHSVADYLWQAALLFYWYRMRSRNGRLAVAAVAVVAYLSEWFSFKYSV